MGYNDQKTTKLGNKGPVKGAPQKPKGEFKRYDTQHELRIFNARVVMDAKEIKEGFVKVTTVLTSAKEGDEDIWLTIVPSERDAPLAAQLRKGDVIGGVTGFLTMRKWGEDEKIEHELKFPRLSYSIDLLQTLKKRADGGGDAQDNVPDDLDL